MIQIDLLRGLRQAGFHVVRQPFQVTVIEVRQRFQSNLRVECAAINRLASRQRGCEIDDAGRDQGVQVDIVLGLRRVSVRPRPSCPTYRLTIGYALKTTVLQCQT